jgi:hypothetical protein
VSNVTERARPVAFNGGRVERAQTSINDGTGPMLTAIIVTFIIVVLLGYSLRSGRSGRSGELIVHRPYNNRYNDASGAREDHLS